MKTFKQYIEENKKPKEEFFKTYVPSFAELRSDRFFKHRILNFSELRDSDLQESFMYDEKFHDHLDIKPLALSKEHETALKNYTSATSVNENGHGSSDNINSYLSNRGGLHDRKILGPHTPEHVLKSVKVLSSAFTPENTNKKEIHTYNAVPREMGEELESMKSGRVKSLSQFTSTTSNYMNADTFANSYHNKSGIPDAERVDHLVHYTVPTGLGISVVNHSPWSENEVLLHHGIKIKYSHTETKVRKDNGILTKMHHVIVLPETNKLDYSLYGTYQK